MVQCNISKPIRRTSGVLAFLLLCVLSSYCEQSRGETHGKNTNGAEASLTIEGREVPKPTMIWLNIKVPFEITNGGILAIANSVDAPPGAGYPIEAHQAMILLYPDKEKAFEFTSLKELRGKVSIRTAEEALAFCRLTTSPKTWYLFDEEGLEVVSREQIDVGFCFGDERECEFLRKNATSGYLGVVDSDETMIKLGIKTAIVVKKKTGYEIKRTLLLGDPITSDYFLLDVTELVGEDGSYIREPGQKRWAPATGSAHWCIPFFM